MGALAFGIKIEQDVCTDSDCSENCVEADVEGDGSGSCSDYKTIAQVAFGSDFEFGDCFAYSGTYVKINCSSGLSVGIIIVIVLAVLLVLGVVGFLVMKKKQSGNNA